MKPNNSTSYDYLFEVTSEPVSDLLTKMKVGTSALQSKVALVTGAARGIGEQVARGLAHAGATVVLVDFRDEVKAVTESIASAGGKVSFIQTDIAVEENILELLQEVQMQMGEIDILVNNAVHIDIYSVLEMSMEEWDRSMFTNIRSVVLTTKLLLPGMLAKKQGTILNVIAVEGMAYSSAMSASKAALRSFTVSLASEIGTNSGVNIVGFAPSFVNTPMVQDVFPRYAERMGFTFEDYALKMTNNPGYEGLMPPEHCGSAIVHTIINSGEFHGLFADAFLPLSEAGIITVAEPSPIEQKPDLPPNEQNITRLTDYIAEISQFNKSIEQKVEFRTRELEQEQALTNELLQKIASRSLELQETKEELEEKNKTLTKALKELNSFSYVISHDLKAPLRGISSLATFIENDLGDNLQGEVKLHIENLKSRVIRMTNLIDAVLDYARVGKISEKEKLVNTGKILLEIKETLLQGTPGTISFPDSIPQIVGSQTMVYQLFQNLIGNGLKYNDKDSPAITVDSLEEKGVLCFSITDNGMGIDPKYFEKIFTIFQTLQPRDELDSTGIGLTIAKKIVEEHGGRIWLESELGIGTTFYFTWPNHTIEKV